MIVSSFYLIKGDGKPIYVGFTNRSIKQRFAEHKTSKNFSDYKKVTVEEIDRLDYAFTWDEDVLYKNANEVSVREAQLILEYGTQDSKYQKSIGGGQVWTYEKWFVRTNKDNPKFLGMTSEQVEDYLNEDRAIKRYMGSFISNMQLPERQYMNNFISSMEYPVKMYLRSFVKRMEDPVKTYLRHFIGNMEDSTKTYMRSFVNHMEDPVKTYLGDFVKDMELPEKQYMKNFVKHMKIINSS